MKNSIVLIVFLCELIGYSQSLWVPKILWTYVTQQVQEGSYKQLFHLNRVKYANDWQIRTITMKNVSYYLQQIPNFDGLPYYYQDQIKSYDIIKPSILSHYGGVWMDYTSFLTENLTQWLQIKSLAQNPDIEQPKPENIQVLFFSLNATEYPIDPNYNYPKYLIWFIATKPQSKLILQLNRKVQKMISNDKIRQRHLGAEIIKSKQGQQAIFQYDHSLLFTQIIQQILEDKQHELDTIYSAQNRHYSIDYYQIWYINALNGPYNYLKYYYIWNKQPINSLLYFGQNNRQKLNMNQRYFVQLNQLNEQKLNRVFVGSKHFLSNCIDQLIYRQNSCLLTLLCPQINKIKADSIIGMYLVGESENFDIITSSVQFTVGICSNYVLFENVCFIAFMILLIVCLKYYFTVKSLKYIHQKQLDNNDEQKQNLTQSLKY